LILTDATVMQREFWQQLRDYGATSFGGVPYIYEMLDKLRLTRMDLPSIRTMTQAGGRLRPDLHLKLAEYADSNGIRFFVMYGQTEATARMSYLPPERSVEKNGSIGVAIPGGSFSLSDEDGCVIPDAGTVGELVYEGANVALGYAERGEDLARGDDWGGVLRTGDMAKRDADSFYYVVGRRKRFLKLFGIRFNLDEAEELVRSEFEGVECACAGQDDLACVYVTDATMQDEVRNFLVHKTGIARSGFRVKAVAALPRNESGKVLYAELDPGNG
jgi:acyl-coenzyme A synthetase/AMP-(fatty) acid ligase